MLEEKQTFSGQTSFKSLAHIIACNQSRSPDGKRRRKYDLSKFVSNAGQFPLFICVSSVLTDSVLHAFL